MKRTRAILALLMALVLSLSLGFGVFADPSYTADIRTELAEDYTGKTVILHSNDVHGEIAGYAYIAGLRDALKEKGAEVILVDAGDFSQGDPNVSVSKGLSAVEMMNAAAYDYVTLGNHEFDFGSAQLRENLAQASFKTICADVYADGALLLDGSVVCTGESGLKIGFFGMETPETATKVNPGMIKEISFATFDELYASAQTQIDALKAENVDLVISLAHLGVDDESAANGYRSIDLYSRTTGIDFILDGHSHTVMTIGPAGEPIQSTGTKFAYVGVVVIDNATKQIEDHFLMATKQLDEDGNVVAELLPKDEAVAAKAAEIAAVVDAQYGAVFAQSEVSLNGERSPGNLITDAMLWSVVNAGSITQVPAENIVAITNGGGIRAAVNPGDVTMKDINTVLPFGNTVAVIYVTGSELLEALEASTYELPIGGYPQTAGIKWTLDTTKDFDQGSLYIVGGKETTYYGPNSIQRVSIQSVNGKDFDPEAMYAVVTNNFVAAGGDTYAVFNKAYERTDEYAGFDTSIPLDQAVVDYIKTELGGVIPASRYATDRGDMTMVLPEAPEGLATAGAESYVVEGARYFKLRDVAALLNGSDAQFSVGYDEASDTVTIVSGEAYAPIGGELSAGADRSAGLIPSPHSISINGAGAAVNAYIIDGANFLRIEDLAQALGFEASFDDATGTLTVAA